MAYAQQKDDARLSQASEQNDVDQYGSPSNEIAMSFGTQASSTFMTFRLSQLGCVLLALATAVIFLLVVILIGVQLHYTKELDRKTDSLSWIGEESTEHKKAVPGDDVEQNPTPAGQIGGGGQEHSTPRTPNGHEMQTTNQGLLTSAAVDISTAECVVAAGTEDLEAGDPFNDNSTYLTEGRITGFDVRVRGSDLTGIRFYYGGRKTNWKGTWTDVSLNRVTLGEDELITGLTMYEGFHHAFLGVIGITFETSQGRSLGPYGSTSQTYTVGFWEELLYISGRSGGLIDMLEVHARGCNNG